MTAILRTYWQAYRRFNRDVRLALSSHALVSFAMVGIMGVLFNLYLLRLGFDAVYIGLVAGISSMARAVACLLAGSVGARWGARRPMMAGIIVSIIFMALLLANEWLPAGARGAWILIAYVLAAAGQSTHMVFCTPFLSASTDATTRTHVFSVLAAISPLASFAGSLIGGLLPGALAGALGASLSDVAPYRYALLLAPLLLLPTLPILRAVRDMDRGMGQGARQAAERGSAAPYGIMAMLVVVMLFRWAGRAPTSTFFNVYLDDQLGASTALIGALAAAGSLLNVPGALFMPAIVARWGAYHTLIWCTVAMGFCLLPLALVPHWLAAGLSYVLTLGLYGITSPAITVYSQEMVSAEWRPAMSGIMNMSVGLGSGLMAFGGGYAIAALGYRPLFLISAICMAIGAVVFWAYFRTPRGEMRREGRGTLT
ncbi:MAG: MFS transporter [Chloroflexi bacterium]|nr:MFS transporter [Chloroflexota bacterium]